jgi:hypothetical protein
MFGGRNTPFFINFINIGLNISMSDICRQPIQNAVTYSNKLEKDIQYLKGENQMLRRQIADEAAMNHQLLIRIAELTRRSN